MSKTFMEVEPLKLSGFEAFVFDGITVVMSRVPGAGFSLKHEQALALHAWLGRALGLTP